MSADNRWTEQHMHHVGVHPEYSWVQRRRPRWATEYFRCCTGETLAAPELVAPSFQKVPIRRYSARQIRRSWNRAVGLVRQGLMDDTLHFYIHFPFCAQRCRYCCWFSKRLSSEREIEGFIQRTLRQFRYFKETFSGIRFKSLSFGGGTPSLLSASQTRRLMTGFNSCFNMSSDGYVTTEFNPSSVTEDKVRAMQDAGFTRISLGVQTFDTALLHSVNRGYQTEATVARAFDILQRAGFRNGYNADLLAGLERQEPGDVLSSFEKLAGWGVPSIVTQMVQPTPTYGRGLLFRRNLEFVARRVREELPPLAQKGGYEYCPMFDEVGPCEGVDHFSYVRRDAPAAFKLDAGGATGNEIAMSPFTYGSVFAIGPMAISTISGAMFYRETPQEEDFDPASPLYEGSSLDRESEILWRALSRIDAGRGVSMPDLDRRLGRGARAFITPFLTTLQGAGIIRTSRGRLTRRASGKSLLPCVCSVKSPWARAFVKTTLDFQDQVRVRVGSRLWIVDIETPRPRKDYSLRLAGLGFGIPRDTGNALSGMPERIARSIRRLSRAYSKAIPTPCLTHRASFIADGLKKEFSIIDAEFRKAELKKGKAISALEKALRAAPPNWPRRVKIEKVLNALRARAAGLDGPGGNAI